MNPHPSNDTTPDADNLKPISSMDNSAYSSTQNIGSPQNVILSATHTEITSSPLPSPEILRGYNDLIKDGAERFMKMVEKEQENRFDNDRSAREREKSEINLKRREGSLLLLC